MKWTLHRSGAADPQTRIYMLRDENTAYVVSPGSEGSSAGVVHELPDPDVYTELGRITLFEGIAKLEAINSPLQILSVVEHGTIEAFTMRPIKDGRVEILLLRDGDIFSPKGLGFNFTCKKEPASEVQVNSSAAEHGAQEEISGRDGVTDAVEEETEDEDLDKTTTTIKATQTKSQPTPFQPTPRLSEQRSIVVQETPTTGRIGAAEYMSLKEIENGQDQHIQNTPTPEVLEQAGAQPFSTARTGQTQHAFQSTNDATKTPNASHSHGADESSADEKATTITKGALSKIQSGKRGPKVVVARKRSSPAPEYVEVDEEQAERSNKRAKRNPTTDDNTQDSNLSNIVVDTSPTVASTKKGRKRKSVVNDGGDLDEGTPRSNRSSQGSTFVTNADSYMGETPCVATSHSAITEKSHAAKFLKKQGGSLVDSVKDDFNVLCVRDGELSKTPKLLQAIAAGIPIVTDKWLFDSAKAGQLLSVDAYKPQSPEQEEEWKVKFDSIIGHPQTPFEGYTLHFTTGAHAKYNPFTDIEHVCKTAGVEKITIKRKLGKKGKIVVIAAEKDDKEAEKLVRDGTPCYYRGILPMSIIRGTFDLESEEFKVGPDDIAKAKEAEENEAKTKKGRHT